MKMFQIPKTRTIITKSQHSLKPGQTNIFPKEKKRRPPQYERG